MLDFLSQYWYVIFGAIGGGTFLFVTLRNRSRKLDHPSAWREGEVRKISSSPLFYKRMLPIIFGCVAFFMLMDAFSETSAKKPVDYELVLIPAIMLVGVLSGWWIAYAGLADEVWDHGKELVVRRGDTTVHIPLTDMGKVSYSTISKDPCVTIKLNKPGVLGDKISFVAMSTLFASDKAMIAESLIYRIAEAGKNK